MYPGQLKAEKFIIQSCYLLYYVRKRSWEVTWKEEQWAQILRANGEEERKVQLFQFLEETQVVQWTEVSFLPESVSKIAIVKGVILFCENQTQGLTLFYALSDYDKLSPTSICVLKRGAWYKTQVVANSGIHEIMKNIDQQLSRSAFLTAHN